MHLHKKMGESLNGGFAWDIQNKNNRIYLTLALSKDRTMSGDFIFPLSYIFSCMQWCL